MAKPVDLNKTLKALNKARDDLTVHKAGAVDAATRIIKFESELKAEVKRIAGG